MSINNHWCQYNANRPHSCPLTSSASRGVCFALGTVPACSALGWAATPISWMVQLCQGHSVFILLWEEKVHSPNQRWAAGLYEQLASSLVPDWSIFMQMRALNLHSLIGPKGTILTGLNRGALMEWRKPQPYWLR